MKMKPRDLCTLLFLAVLLPSSLCADEKPKFYDPVQKQIEGWTVAVDPKLLTKEHEQTASKAFEALARQCRLVRTWGDCYGYLLLATGWADIMCDPDSSLWDIAPLVPVVRGAGGVITDWQGRDPVKADSMLAATPGLHAQVIRALNP